MKHLCKRALALVLALVMIIGMAPTMTLHAHAATIGGSGLTDTTIGLTASDPTANWKGDKGTVTWTANGTDVTCVATGNGGLFKVAADSTLTITNNGEAGTLAFDWTLTGDGSVTGGIVSGTSGSYTGALANGANATISIQSSKGAYSCTLTLSKLRIIRGSTAITSTFKPGENGSYTVDGTVISEVMELGKPATESYALVATPASGYQFLGWYNETTDTYFSYSNSTEIYLEESSVIYPVFVSSSTAIFGVGDAKFADLNKANTAASNNGRPIVLLNNGTLAAGDYTISSGNTLLIPYDSANTVHTSGKSDSSLLNNPAWVQPTAYRTLTMANGAKITVNGAVNVGGIHHSANGGNPYGGSPTGPVGFIHMNSGSHIEVASSGKLYVWGYIKGEGTIHALDGSEVHENMQITDFRGGTATKQIADGVADHKVFPFSQYYVQNIEVALTLEDGAAEHAHTSVFASSMNNTASLVFIGSGGLFSLTDGSVTKKYNGATDRLELTLNSGTVSINNLKMDVIVTINSKDYVLPITSNITILVKSGCSVELNQDLALLPGAEVTIEQGATLHIPGGASMYVYDEAQWGTYTFYDGANKNIGPLIYAPGRAAGVSTNHIKDAKVDLNGALSIDGNVYTTESGANIITSEGSGTVTLNVAPAAETGSTYQFIQNGGFVTIPVTPLKLHNGDNKYTETAKAPAGTTYYWNTTCPAWSTARTGHVIKTEELEPTCVEDGYIRTFCEFCAEEEVEILKAEGRHYFDPEETGLDPIEIVPPTCTEQGYSVYICAVCESATEKRDFVDPLGHKYESVVTDPTCTEKGYTTYTCTVCGDSYMDNYVDALGHNYVAGEVVAPTCTAAGYTVYSCTNGCGDTYTDDEVPALPHTEETIPGKEATCTATGLTEGKKCTDCGTITVAQEEIPVLPHTEETIPGKEATCTETGLTDGKKCTVCGTTTVAREEIPVLPHTEETIPGKAATCTATGLTDGVKCSVCGHVITAQNEIAALGHDYKEEITIEAGCTSEGQKTFTCSRCGDSYTQAISATGHTEVADEAVDATCTTPGKTAGAHCSVCKANLYGNEEISALGHKHEGVVTAPTCTEKGYTTYTCTVCGDSYVADEVAAQGHKYETVVTAPTCTAVGYTTYTCTVCGDSYVADEVAALGHKYETVVTAPTCTEKGYTTYTCSVCGDSYVADEVAALGHETTTEVVAPTCTAEGYTTVSCGRCDYEERTDVVPAQGHTEQTVPGKAATCTEPGLTDGVICSVCEHIITVQVEIPAAGHKHKAVVTEPTCTEKGYTTYTCAVCGDSYVADYVDVLDHSYDTFVETVEPTCTEDGYTVYKCQCGATEKRDEVAALGHDYKAAVTDPGCVTQGYTTYTCGNCNHSYIDPESYVAATGHAMGEWYTVTEATCTTDGLSQSDCANCDHYESKVIVMTGHTEKTVAGKEATCTEDGLTDGVICSVCGETITKQEVIEATGEHNYEEGKCTMCGEAKYQVNDHGASLLLEGMVHVNKYWGVPGLSQEELKAAEFYMIVTPGDGSESYRVELEVKNSKYNGAYDCTGATEGIPAKNMIDALTMQAFIVIDGVTYESEPVTYGVLDYCEGRFKKSTDESLKKLLVSMLNYGAAAQTNLKYKTDNLVNAKLEEYVAEFGLNPEYLNMNWSDDYLTPAAEASAAMAANFADGTLRCTGKSLLLEGAIAVKFYCSVGEDNSKFQADTAKMYYWTAADYAKLEAQGIALSKDNASYTSEGKYAGYTEGYGYEYTFESEQIAAKNLEDTLFAVMTIQDAEGVEYYTNVFSYSAEVYARNKLNDNKVNTLDDLCKWMVIYGERAKSHFTK